MVHTLIQLSLSKRTAALCKSALHDADMTGDTSTFEN